MKLGKLGSAIKAIIQPMERLGATASAKALSLLCSLFDELKDIEAENFVDRSKSARADKDQSATIGDVRTALEATLEFMKAVGAPAPKKAAVSDAKEVLRFLDNEISFAAFANEIKAALLVDVVDFHLKALKASLGKPNFDAAYAALEKDVRVTGPKLAEITTHFVSRTAKSSPKTQMLQRIYARHASMVDLAKKNEWQRGKSAA